MATTERRQNLSLKQAVSPKFPFQEKLMKAGIFSIIGLGFAIPLSTSLTSIFTILVSFFWLVSGRIKEINRDFMHNAVVRAALVLFALFFVGITYSSAGLNEAFHGLFSYRKLFLIAIFSSFLKEKRHQQWAIYAFFIGCFILLATSCLSAWKISPAISYPGNTICGRVTHSTYMAFFAFWLAVNIVKIKRFRAVYSILFCLIIYNMFFVVNGRSGYVLFLSLMLFLFYRSFSKKQFALGILIMVLLLSSSFFLANNKFSARMIATKNNFISYRQTGKNNSSIGQRLDFAKTSLALFVKRPIWGYGTGSFKKEYEKISQQMGTYKTDNPHNEYLSIAVQLGLLGLLLFVYLLFTQWSSTTAIVYENSQILRHEKILAQGFVLTMVIGSFMNSMLLDSGEGHFFAFFSAIISANIKPGR